MNKLKIILTITAVVALAVPALALHPSCLPQPQFSQTNFMRLDNPLEFNVDYALQWTDSAASLFIQPFDAVVLHVDVDDKPMDVFIISDIGMQRLTIWMCTEPDQAGKRELLLVTAYRGEVGDEFKTPSGLATNAVNRKFDPKNDVIYVADRGNDRIVELAYTPDSEGGKLRYNRFIGETYLEWPVDVAISAYGDGSSANVDLYVVDWDHLQEGMGELHRFSLAGVHEGAWHNVCDTGNDLVITELYKPVSVACYPDTIIGNTLIYVVEEKHNVFFQFISNSNDRPEYAGLNAGDRAIGAYLPGGIALDDYGRIYLANTGMGTIQMHGPYLDYDYVSFGELGDGPGQLYYPVNIVLDTYYGVCEALIIEYYYRQSGLQTHFIGVGSSPKKPQLGFVAAGLVRPPVESSSGILPGVFTLNEAYPNPFNSSCLITFAIPERSDVKIDVFNILGQQVTTLLDEARDAGKHSIVFDADRFSSGIYFYRLKTESFSEVKSMTLLK